MNISLSITNPRTYRIAVSAFFFLAGITFASWASRIPHIKEHLHLSDGALGTILLALPIGLMTGLPLAGWAVTKYGSKATLTLSTIMYPLILVSLGLTNEVWQLALGLFFFGLLGNLMNISVNTQAVSVESAYGRTIMASFHGMWSLAGFAGAGIGTLMVSAGMSPLTHFIIIAALMMLIVLVGHRYAVPKDPPHNGKQTLFAKPDKTILKFGIIAFACMACEGTMFDWSGVYFKTVVLAPESKTTIGYVAFMCTMAAGRFTTDRLINRFGVKPMLRLSGILITVGLLVSIIFPYLIPATIGFLLVGFGVSSVVPTVYGLAGRSKTMSPGIALAAVSSISFFGFLLGPPIIGFIAEASSLRWSFALVSCLGLVTAFMAGKIKTD
ncbi:MAG: MFS transporter [Bacteroidota bacterium]